MRLPRVRSRPRHVAVITANTRSRDRPGKDEATGEPRRLPGVKAVETHLAPSSSSVTFLRRPRPSS